jgi:hypothetical protein
VQDLRCCGRVLSQGERVGTFSEVKLESFLDSAKCISLHYDQLQRWVLCHADERAVLQSNSTLNTDNWYAGKRIYLEVPFEEKMMQRRLVQNGIPCGSWDSSFSELQRDLLSRSDYTM